MKHKTGSVAVASLVVLVGLLAGCGSEAPFSTDGRPSGDEDPLTESLAGEADALAPPAGEQIAFANTLDTHHSSIMVMEPDGSNVHAITSQEMYRYATEPDWSPDGTRIVYTKWVNGHADIWVMTRKGYVRRRLTRASMEDYGPAWSPDGTRIAFASNRKSGGPRIFVMNADGSQQQWITRPVGTRGDRNPDWSPDGTQIVFDRYDNLLRDLWIVNADGTGERKLVSCGQQNWFTGRPAWSPDGTRIAFCKGTKASRADIYAVRPDGTDVRAVVKSTTDESDPCWSPDGSQLAFIKWSAALTRCDLYVAKADGTRQHRVTETGHAYSPSWWGPH
jgi:Tol biopolymer transport system component